MSGADLAEFVDSYHRALAYLVEVERFEARVGGAQETASGALRATTVLRPEDGFVADRPSARDPITGPREAGSVVQR